jgi:hypothetical protein
VILSLALVAVSAAPRATASAGETSCGLVAVHLSREELWSLNSVGASGVPCDAARALVRSWVLAVADGRIPARVTAGVVTPGNMIVFGRFGPPYGFEGYTCRWASVKPSPHSAFLPGKGRCSSGGAMVTWAFRAASNPTLGQVRGCAGGVTVGNAVVSTIRARTVSCARAKTVIRYLLVHRVIRAGRHGLRLVRPQALGFRLSHEGPEFRAQRGQTWFSFRLYLETCGC